MSESMMVKGSDRIAANAAIPIVTPIDTYAQPVTLSQIAPEVAKMPPTAMITLNIPQIYVILLAAGCLILIGFVIGSFLYKCKEW